MIRFVFKAVGVLCCVVAAMVLASGVAWKIQVWQIRRANPYTWQYTEQLILINDRAITPEEFERGHWIIGGVSLVTGIAAFAVSGRTRRPDAEPHST